MKASVEKRDTEPLLANYPSPPLSQRKHTLRSSFALGICLLLLTASWHAFRYFSVPVSTRAPEICDKLRLLHRHASYAVARDKGVSVSHRSLAIDPHIKHEGQVYVEGTESDEISVIVDYWTSSKHLAKGVEISIVNQNEIIITTDEVITGRRDCVQLDVTVQIPSFTPFVKLNFAYSNIQMVKSLSSTIDQFDVSTNSGSVFSNSSSFHTNSWNIHTSEGLIKGHYSLGETLVLSSTSGYIDVGVTVNPAIHSSKASFHTSTTSGFTHVHFLGALKHRSQMASIHESENGRVHVSYPPEWEGVVEASTSSDSLMLMGKGLEIVECRENGTRYEKAVKGDDWENKATVDISTSEGSILFELGGKFAGKY